nr:TlpA disulfide reductase family protein [uncultured Psychroserpens sp.]
MKKIITILLVGVLLVACKTDNKTEEVLLDGYMISGTAPGIYNGIRMYLQSNGERGRMVNVDTAIVMNERFTFEGKVKNPQVLLLSVNSITGNVPIIVENKKISIELDKDNIGNSIISGTKANEDLIAYQAKLKDLANQRKELGVTIRATNDADEKNELSTQYKSLNDQYANLPISYIENNPNSLYSLVLLDNLIGGRNSDLNKIAELYDGLDDAIKTTVFGNKINTKLVSVRRQKEALSATEIGKPAPKFTAPTPDGKNLALDDAMGKVTIIDFWAAWCGPCRRENPNVVKVYNKYHDKGLEIIGVSLDGTKRQKDPKDAWTKAIAQDKLTWNHVSNLNYFDDPVARAYNIRSIPATFILDENGTIVAKNLRGADLEAKIAELLN